MRFTLACLLFSFSVLAQSQPAREKQIIDGPPLLAVRCMELTPEECRRERDEYRLRGCVSDWAHKELGEKRGPKGEIGGYPQCTVQNALKSWCYCGCFHPDTRILVHDKHANVQIYVRAGDIIKDLSRYELMVLDESADRNAVTLTPVAIEKYTSGPEKPALVIASLSSGVELKVSSQHAVMLSDGRMVVAEDLKEGEFLIGEKAEPVRIEKIVREKTEEQVINFMTVGKTLRSHMLIAEGVVVGDVAYQNDLVSLLDLELL
jgi:hypothetical protein